MIQRAGEEAGDGGLFDRAAGGEPSLAGFRQERADLRPRRDAAREEVRAPQGKNRHRLRSGSEVLQRLEAVRRDIRARLAGNGGKCVGHDLETVLGGEPSHASAIERQRPRPQEHHEIGEAGEASVFVVGES